MEFKIPQSLKEEHEELRSDLVNATKVGGKLERLPKQLQGYYILILL